MATPLIQEVQQAIEAIDHKTVTLPHMPVEEFIRYCEKLVKRATDDKENLLAVGLDWALVEKLEAGLQALRLAEAQWKNTRHVRGESEEQWMTRMKVAYRLRDSLLNVLRFACRKDNNLLARVAEFAEGRSHGDMVQDLQDIAVFARAR